MLIQGSQRIFAEWLLVILFVNSVLAQGQNDSISDDDIIANPEVWLVQKLLGNVDANAKPFWANIAQINVSVGFTLGRISSLDEKSQVLTSFGWIIVMWYDHHLFWDPSKHNNITKLVLNTEDVWMPEIAIVNTVNEGNDLTMSSQFRVQVFSGFLIWVPGFRLETTCQVDLTLFPFDEQLCFISLTSWSFDKDMVSLTSFRDYIDIDNYEHNGEWDLLGTYAYEETAFNSVTFLVLLGRKPTFYMMNIVIPTLIMSAVAVLVFALPVESGEKISLGISILLSYSVLMLIVSDMMPKTADTVPILAIYMTAAMGLTGASLFATVAVINIHHHSSSRKIPKWVRTVFLLGLGRVLCMSSAYNNRPISGTNDIPQKARVTRVAILQTPRQSATLAQDKDEDVNVNIDKVPPHVHGDSDGTAVIRKNEEWKLLASVIDRLFLIIFLLVTVITAAVVIISITNKKVP